MGEEIDRKKIGGMRGLALVEIYKEGCETCDELQSKLDGLSERYSGKIDFYQSHFVQGGLGNYFGLNINNVPTVLLLNNGELVDQFTGAKYAGGIGGERQAADTSFLERKIDSFLGNYQIVPTNQSHKEGGLESTLNLGENSMKTLRERYLKKDSNGRVIERPEEMFRRVADNIASAELIYGGSKEYEKEMADKFYDIMTKMEFLPNSPTLMNAGRDLQQLSACFVVPIGDTMEAIFQAATYGALIHKSGGGTGYSFGELRPKNSIVRSTSGVASGPVSFIDVFNVYTETVKQGGTRRGANMGILPVNHPDIRDFIHAKGELNPKNREIVDKLKTKLELEESDPIINNVKKTLIERTQLNNFNLSVGLTEKFMDAVRNNSYFELINPHTQEITERISATSILEEIIDQAWKTGEPGIIFLDRINEHNPTPHVGEIAATNPCGEQPLLPYESCNLGSINLAKMVKKAEKSYSGRLNNVKYDIDWEKLGRTVRTAVNFLDNIIDKNRFPLPDIEQMTKANRKIGLGVMGFADMVTLLGVPYGSEGSIEIAEKVMKFVRDEARKSSVELADKRGMFPNWEGSIYDSNSKYFKGEELKLRNATLTTIAPTGTIAQIADCEWGLEAPFSIASTKTVMDGKVLHYRFRSLERVIKEEGYDAEGIFEELEQGKREKFDKLPERIKELAATSMNLTPRQHIDIQVAFQKYTDNAVSKTINFPSTATKEDVKEAYLLAYRLGCKGLTVYRDRSRDEQVFEEISAAPEFNFGSKRPKELLGITRQEVVGDGKKVFLTVNYFEGQKTEKIIEELRRNGKPSEIFVNANYFDPATQALTTGLAMRCSKDLRKGIDSGEIVEDLRHLPPSNEIGYDAGFGPGMEYVNTSVPDAMGKALGGFKPPKKKSSKNSETSEQKQSEEKKQENPNGYGFCRECSRYGVIHQEGCDKCIFCGHSKKGCSS